MGDNNNTIDKATTQLEQKLIKRVEELERINIRLQSDNEARELAHEGLRYGQKFLREVISSVEDTYFTVFDQNCVVNFIWGSKKIEEKYGIIFQDFMGKDSNDFNPPLAKKIRELFETNQSFHGERYDDRRENKIWWDFTLSPIRDEDNEMVAVVSAARDITERKRNEELLKESEEKLKMFMDSATDGFVLWDPELNYIDANKVAVQTTGLTKEELIGKNMLDIAPNLRETGRYDQYLDVLKTGKPFSTEDVIFNKLDKSIDASFSIRAFKVGINLGVIFTDISERKRNEQKLKDSEEKLRIITENSPDNIIFLDLAGKIKYINYTVEDLSVDQVMDTPIFDYLPPNSKQTAENSLNKVKKTRKKDSYIVEYHPVEGEIQYFETRVAPVIHDGEVVSYITNSSDITERKNNEEELKLNTEIMTNLAEGVILIRIEDGTIVFTNPAFEAMFGYDQGEMLGKNISIANAPTEKTPEETREDIMGILKETGRWHGEIKNIKKDGTFFWCFANVSTFDHPNYGKVTVSVHTDITERKENEDELRLHSEMMENMSEGVYLIRLEDGIIVYTNPALEKMFGYNPGEMINKYVTIVNAPTDKSPEETKEEIMGILKETGEWHGEVRNIKKDGTHFWCYANVSLFDHPKYGKVIVSIHNDISERKISDEKIKQLAKFPSENPNSILRVSKDGYLLYSNNASKSVLNTWNHKKNYPIPKKYLQFVLNTLITGEKHYTELVCICEEKNCIDKTFSLTFAPVEGTNYVNIYGFDITERVKAEESLKESEEKFRLIFKNVRDGIVGVNEEGNFEFANITAAKNLGYELDEFLKLNITDISASESKKEFKQHFSDMLGTKRLKFETIHRKKDNILRNIEVLLNIFDLKDKKISLAIWHDITDFKRSEEALRESGEILRSILENSPDYIIMMDIEGEIQFINRPFIGMQRGEINNKNIFSFIPLEYHGILKNSISQMIESGRVENIKLKIKNPLGNPNLYELHFGYIKSDWEIIGLIIIFSENN